MAIIDEAKTWLRVSTNDAGITSEIEMLINAALADLSDTSDVKEYDVEALPPLVKLAVRSYVQANWTKNVDDQTKLLVIYDGIKAKLATSSKYNVRSSEASNG